MAGWGSPSTARPRPGAFGPSGSPVPQSAPVASPAASTGPSQAALSALTALANRPAPQIQQMAPPQISNYAQNNPGLEAALQAAQRRTGTLEGRETTPDPFQMESIRNLRDRMSKSNTQHAIDQAGNAIKTSAAGAQAALDEQMARRGLGSSGLAGRGAFGLAEVAERAKAKSATDLSLAEQQRLDQLALGGNAILQAPSQLGLAQQGLTNSALGLQMQGAGALANQGLAQQGLGLNQWQAGQNAAYQQQQLQQQQQMMQWQQLMALLGYAG